MMINNPLYMKDWKIKDFILLVITLQIIYFLSVILGSYVYPLSLVTQLVGSFMLLFVPGTIILRLLKVDIPKGGQILLYTTGISLFLVMFIGFLMNTLYPLMGFKQPLSSLSIMATFTGFILFSCLIDFLVNRHRNQHADIKDPMAGLVESSSPGSIKSKIDLKELPPLAPYLVLVLIPILSVLGAYTMNIFGSNILTLLLIISFAVMAFMVSTSRISHKWYPLMVFSISVAMVLHMSLITNYIWGWDINGEYFLANNIISTSMWNTALSNNYNSMLSVVVLAPIFHGFLNLNLVWVMKIVYPLLFSMLPLGLYYVYYKQTCPKIAFFAAFFSMILFTFYTEMLSLARQEIAELFLVLLLMVLVGDYLNKTSKSILAIIFGASIVVSHYGLSYLLMIILIMSVVILFFMDYKSHRKPFNLHFDLQDLKPHKSSKGYDVKTNRVNPPEKPLESLIAEKIRHYQPSRYFKLIITPPFIALFVLLILIWYFYTSDSSLLQSFMGIGENIINNLFSLMDPNTSQGLSLMVQGQVTPLKNVHKYFYLISQFFILVGVLTLFFGKYSLKFNSEYRALSYATFFTLVLGLFLPFFSSQMNTSRLYHIALIVLAPFCILGIITFIYKLKTLIHLNLRDHSFQIVSIFLIVFMLFDTGFIYAVADPVQSTSISLNPSVDFPKFNDREVAAGNWLVRNDYKGTVFADQYRTSVLRSMLPTVNELPGYSLETCSLCNRSKVFLGTWNVNKNQILVVHMEGANVVVKESYESTTDLIKDRSKIYDNGGSNIYGAVI